MLHIGYHLVQLMLDTRYSHLKKLEFNISVCLMRDCSVLKLSYTTAIVMSSLQNSGQTRVIQSLLKVTSSSRESATFFLFGIV